jgi:hypothetical protein
MSAMTANADGVIADLCANQPVSRDRVDGVEKRRET